MVSSCNKFTIHPAIPMSNGDQEDPHLGYWSQEHLEKNQIVASSKGAEEVSDIRMRSMHISAFFCQTMNNDNAHGQWSIRPFSLYKCISPTFHTYLRQFDQFVHLHMLSSIRPSVPPSVRLSVLIFDIIRYNVFDILAFKRSHHDWTPS